MENFEQLAIDLEKIAGQIRDEVNQPEVEEGQYRKAEEIKQVYRISKVADKIEIEWLNDDPAEVCKRENLVGDPVLSDDQVQQALIEEAERRGYERGGKIENWLPELCNPIEIGHDEEYRYYPNREELSLGDTWIYKQGEWAEIIEDEWEVVRKGLSAECIVKNINGDIISGVNFYFDKEQAETIKEALNRC